MPPRPRTDTGAAAVPSAGGARFPMGGQKSARNSWLIVLQPSKNGEIMVIYIYKRLFSI